MPESTQRIEYADLNTELDISFTCEQMGLREIGLICNTIHRSINKVAEKLLTLPPEKHSWKHDPNTVSLVATQLSFGSFITKAQLKVAGKYVPHKAVDLGVSIAANFIYALMVAAAAGMSADVKAPENPPAAVVDARVAAENNGAPDIGPNLRHLADRLAATGKPWQLSVTDSKSGLSITVKSN